MTILLILLSMALCFFVCIAIARYSLLRDYKDFHSDTSSREQMSTLEVSERAKEMFPKDYPGDYEERN